MNLFGGDSRKTARLFFAAGSILLPLCCAGFLYLCVGKVHSAVTYFHAALAEQGAGVFFSGSFPALQLSVWKESFADQSLLFHLFLYLTQWLDSGIPHTGWIVLLLALFLSACLFAAKGLNLRMRTCFAGSLLLLFLSVPSFNAMTNVSPDLLSAAFLILSTGLTGMELTGKKRLLCFSLLAFAAAWSIPCPQLVLLPPFLTGLLQIRKGVWLSPFQPLAAGLTGMLAGMLIHPQTPATFPLWKLHNWDRIIRALSVQYDANLTAGELLSPTGKEALFALPVLLLCFLALILRIRLQEFRGRGAVRPAVTALLITAWFFTLSFFWVKSVLIFAAPTAVLAFLSLADTMFRGDESPWKPYWKKAAWGFFAATVLWSILTASFFTTGQVEVKLPVQTGQYLKENLPAATPVLNGDWRYFPQLYAVAPQLRWQWGIDPVYSLEKEEKRLRFLTSAIPAEQLSGVIGVRYIVILEPYRSHVRALERCGWQIHHAIPGESWILTPGK